LEEIEFGAEDIQFSELGEEEGRINGAAYDLGDGGLILGGGEVFLVTTQDWGKMDKYVSIGVIGPQSTPAKVRSLFSIFPAPNLVFPWLP